MNALSAFNTRPNLYEGLFFLALAGIYPLYTSSNPPFGWVLVLGCIAFFFSINQAMGNFFFPKPSGYIFIPLYFWWKRNATKYEVTTFQGVQYYESLCDYRTWVLYDKDGYQFGWHGQDYEGYPFFKRAEPLEGKYHRMHWLSRLRSPKIRNHGAEIIDGGGEVIGHTTFTRNN